MSYLWAVASHRGRVRPMNQDSVFPDSSGRGDGKLLMMVADGMGGQAAGEVASALAVETATSVDGAPKDRVVAANLAILREAGLKPELAGMGTTLTMVELEPGGVARFAHVGDSRAYLLRDGELQQLTVDHTLVNEYVRQGKISPDDVATHPQRNIITRALGLSPYLEVDEFDFALAPGDRLLLCSDGVNGMIGDDAIAESMTLPTPEEAAWNLVENANRAGGHDNITALVIEFEGGEPVSGS